MQYKDIITQIKTKDYQPIYVLMGDEPYYIDKISEYISNNILTDEEKQFNQCVLYGKEINTESIIEECKQFPFGSEHRVVIIKEAQNIRKIEKLNEYIENPMRSTILVLCHKYKSIDKRTKFGKNIIKNCITFESKKIYENAIPEWINKFVKKKGLSITNKSCHVLTEYLGNDLSKIKNELNKLIINTTTEINEEIIEKHIGISKHYNLFELQSSLSKKDVLQSNRIINHLSKNAKKNPFPIIISSIFSFFQKVMIYHNLNLKNENERIAANQIGAHPFFIKQYKDAYNNYSEQKLFSIFEQIKEYEMRSKGVNNKSTQEKDLLKELTFKILH